jgi:hypothetical protein
MAKDTTKESAQSSDWFDGSETTDNQLPRVSIGDPSEEKPDSATKILAGLEGTYEGTTSELIDGKPRLLHQILCRVPHQGKPRVALWGNAQIDNSLPCLVPGTKVSFSFQGKRKLQKGKTMKMINLTFPANAIKRPNPFLRNVDEDAAF